jgi:hypothetical protein
MMFFKVVSPNVHNPLLQHHCERIFEFVKREDDKGSFITAHAFRKEMSKRGRGEFSFEENLKKIQLEENLNLSRI